MIGEYHHEKALMNLCQELAEAGFQSQARNAHMQCMTADNDLERGTVMKTLARQVRKLRGMKMAQEVFILQAASCLLLLMVEEKQLVEEIFRKGPYEAAEEAADLLIQNTNLDAARRKLLNDYQSSTGVNETASDHILEAVNRRQHRASALLSLYGARAGGMGLGAYRSQIAEPAMQTLREQAEHLDPEVRKRLGI